MKIAVIGAGYVGLVSGACLAELGHEVVCVDKDAARIDMLRRHVMPVYEPGLEEMVARNIREKRLHFSTNLFSAVRTSSVIFLAVGTPAAPAGDGVDLSDLHSAAEEVASSLSCGALVVNKSTAPVGACRALKAIVSRVRPGLEFDVACNPEFLRQGSAIEDFMRPDRVVIGAESERGRALLGEVYRPLLLNGVALLAMTLESAELTKYAANAFLATKITFINEIADLCERLGADVVDIARGIGLDSRIGSQFLKPGPGYGGSCFPKDTLALLHEAEAVGVDLSIVRSAASKNAQRKAGIAERVVAACGGQIQGKTVALLGLTYKPDTDDVRASPALDIIARLIERGAAVRAYDPHGMAEARKASPEVVFCIDAYDAMMGADALVIATEWNAFRTLDLKRAKTLLNAAIMVDLRNIYRPEDVQAAGFSYHSIGRRSYSAPSQILSLARNNV